MYAIPNCDTVKKARNFLEKNKIDYEFIDFKKTPPTATQIKKWGEFSGDRMTSTIDVTKRQNIMTF